MSLFSRYWKEPVKSNRFAPLIYGLSAIVVTSCMTQATFIYFVDENNLVRYNNSPTIIKTVDGTPFEDLCNINIPFGSMDHLVLLPLIFYRTEKS